jgi:hypothetical protein
MPEINSTHSGKGSNRSNILAALRKKKRYGLVLEEFKNWRGLKGIKSPPYSGG